MSDLTPPPGLPLTPITRARLRERVVAGAHTSSAPQPGRGRSWRVPISAAAAVVLVAGFTGLVAKRAGGDPDAGQPATGLVPTGSPTSDGAATTPTAPPDVAPDRGLQAPQECNSSLRHVLAGAAPVVAFELPSGSPAAFYVKGDRFTLCDVRSHIVTVSQPLPMTRPVGDDVEPFRVSMNFYDADDDGRLDASFLAGGTVPEGAEEFYDALTYTFPDGHVADAVLVTDEQGRTWWAAEYVATRGALVAEGTNLTELDPIRVVLGLSGLAYHFDLTWLDDTCAQANHGC